MAERITKQDTAFIIPPLTEDQDPEHFARAVESCHFDTTGQRIAAVVIEGGTKVERTPISDKGELLPDGEEEAS